MNELKCSHCGAPIAFTLGETMTTCEYCGYSHTIETLGHNRSLLPSDQAKTESKSRERSLLDKLVDPNTLKRVNKITNQSLTRLNNDEPFRLPKVNIDDLNLLGETKQTKKKKETED